MHCCKYIKVPFLKANHNSIVMILTTNIIVANISKFLFWKRITTCFVFKKFEILLLQIYQSSFFESESQHSSATIAKGKIYQSSFFESESQHLLDRFPVLNDCCKYIKVPFLKANHNNFQIQITCLKIVANISKFLFWKRITTSNRISILDP